MAVRARPSAGIAEGCQDARHPGHRRQRVVLQPDRRRGDPPDARHRRARRHGRRGAAARPSGWKAAGSGDLPARHHRATSSTAPSGRTSCTAPRRPAAGGRPRPRAAARPSILVDAARDGLVDAAHDLSDGGLAIALAEASLRHGVGARIWLDAVCERDGIDAFTALFSESTGRAVVAVPRSEEVRFTDMCSARGFAHARIGVVDEVGEALDVQGQFTLPLADLRAAHTATLPAAFGH